MKRIFVSLILTISLLGFYDCGDAKIKKEDFQTIEIIFHDLGKNPKLLESFYRKTGIAKREVTSAIYGYDLNKKNDIKSYIIHDKYFNHDFFNKKIFVKLIGEKVKLLGKKMNINGEDFFIVYEISI